MSSANSTYVAKKALTLANPSTAAVFLQSDNSALAAFVRVPGAGTSTSSIVDGATIYVIASGLVTIGSGGGSTFLPGLYYSAGARKQITIVSGNLVAGTASTSLSASTTYPWFVEATLVWDSSSKVMGGYYDQYVGIASGLTTQAVVINLLSSVDLTTDGAGFVCGCTMGTSQTGTVVTLKQFQLEVV